jgi:hypothetical protein
LATRGAAHPPSHSIRRIAMRLLAKYVFGSGRCDHFLVDVRDDALGI